MFSSPLRIVGFVISLVLALSLGLMQLNMSTGISSLISGNLSMFSGGDYEDENLQSLDVAIVAAPQGGTGQLGVVVEYDPASPDAQKASEESAADAVPVLSEDAGLGEKISFYAALVWHKLFGKREKDDSYEMSCKAKKGGGKVCTVVR